MAEVRPFRALRYDPAVVGDLSCVVSPPYDVIDDAQRAALCDLSPHNFVRLDLPQADAGGDRYAAAAELFERWRSSGALRRDEEPGLYVYEQTFSVGDGRSITRRGFLGVVRLHDYSDRVILPHERTLSGPKADRMALMVATGAQLSQLFLLYDDPDCAIDERLSAARAGEPFADLTTADGILHRLWRVTDPESIAFVERRLADERLLIADGHHRYETALAYRDRRRAEGSTDPDAPHEFALAYLANAADPGLTVWPTHRAIHGLGSFDPAAFFEAAQPMFAVERLPDGASTRDLEEALRASGAIAPSFVVLSRGESGVERRLMRLNESSATDRLTEIPGPEAARALDVTILHEVLLPDLLGVTREAQAAKTNIDYIKGLEAAIQAADDSTIQLVFLMNPLPVPLVRAVCESGGFMPQKSTYFYPKVLSGLVVNDLNSP